MSRTRRYVPHFVIEDALHPWIDPLTLEPCVWSTPERMQYRAQLEASRLRGDDGKNKPYKNPWHKPNEHSKKARNQGKKLILEGYADLLDQWDQEYEDSLDWYDDEPMDEPDWWHDPFVDDGWPGWDDEPEEPDPTGDRWNDDGFYYDPYEY